MKTFSVAFSSPSETFNLEYNVNDHPFAYKWFDLLKEKKVSDLRLKEKAFANFDYSETNITKYVLKLNSLIDILNTFVQPQIQGYFDINYPQESINRLHVHFPALHNSNIDADKIKSLEEYNDTIHFLETMINSKKIFAEFQLSIAKLYLCFNNNRTLDIKSDEYKLFTIGRTFGDVVAHYPQVGRHMMEVYFAGDINIPNDQLRPQNKVSADCSFSFGSNLGSDAYISKIKVDIIRFYKSYGLEKLPYDLDDDRCAIGYIPVAKLKNDYGLSTVMSEAYRNRLQNCKIINISF